ncbi:MAG: tRNA (adenosine(37)-N6)-dimethylallyltransferase MiaA [Dehalococcoidales bacterium]
MNRLVAIIGPTGVGKSRLALALAQAFNGEIVSADSRQVYRYMDIATAKPGRQELALIRHHMVDIINPGDDFSLAQYQGLARRAISDIGRRHKLALLVGGSGLYVWSVLEGWGIPKVPPDPKLRHSLEARAAEVGKDELYRELEQVDPAAASRIERHNLRRVIRALEVHRGTRASSLQHQLEKSPPYNSLIIGLTADRAELYRRIDSRVDAMIERGLVEEVKRLVAGGYGLSLPAMSGIGYRQIGMFLEGALTLEAAVQQIKFESHRFVRRQYNWFKLKDDRIRWFDIQDRADPEIIKLVDRFISQQKSKDHHFAYQRRL